MRSLQVGTKTPPRLRRSVATFCLLSFTDLGNVGFQNFHKKAQQISKLLRTSTQEDRAAFLLAFLGPSRLVAKDLADLSTSAPAWPGSKASADGHPKPAGQVRNR